MPASRQELFDFLDSLDIAHHTSDHVAVFTVAESASVKASLPGTHSKNLFLKDKKGSYTLVIANGETEIDLVALGKHLGAKGRFSFGSGDKMEEQLGVSPGSVTPFCLINERGKFLSKVVLDAALFARDPVWFHPLENTASTAIKANDLISFVEACGHIPVIIELGSLTRETA